MDILSDVALGTIKAWETMARRSLSTVVHVHRGFLAKLLRVTQLPDGNMAGIGRRIMACAGQRGVAAQVFEPQCDDNVLAVQVLVPRAADKERHIMDATLALRLGGGSHGDIRYVPSLASHDAMAQLTTVAELVAEMGATQIVVVSPWRRQHPLFRHRTQLFQRALSETLGDSLARSLVETKQIQYVPLDGVAYAAGTKGAWHMIVEAAHKLGTTGHYEWTALLGADAVAAPASVAVCGVAECPPREPGLCLADLLGRPLPGPVTLLQVAIGYLTAPHAKAWMDAQIVVRQSMRKTHHSGGGTEVYDDEWDLPVPSLPDKTGSLRQSQSPPLNKKRKIEAAANMAGRVTTADLLDRVPQSPLSRGLRVSLAGLENRGAVTLEEWVLLLHPSNWQPLRVLVVCDSDAAAADVPPPVGPIDMVAIISRAAVRRPRRVTFALA